MRVGYSEDQEYGGQYELWHANCHRSRQGRKGQAALRELEAALVALPDKRIQKDVFVEPSGETCAIGALMLHRKVSAGMPREQAVAECAALEPLDTERPRRQYRSTSAGRVVCRRGKRLRLLERSHARGAIPPHPRMDS